MWLASLRVKYYLDTGLMFWLATLIAQADEVIE